MNTTTDYLTPTVRGVPRHTSEGGNVVRPEQITQTRVFSTKGEAMDFARELKRTGHLKHSRVLERSIPVLGARAEVWVLTGHS